MITIETNQHQLAIRKTLAFLIFSLGMSFFGYLYEQIDFIPNYFYGSRQDEASLHWSKFHQLTNPAFYHILPAILAILCIINLWIRKDFLNKFQRKSLILISILTVITNLLTSLAVTQINDQLFFGQNIDNKTNLKVLALLWSGINASRLILIFISGREIFVNYRQAFTKTN